MSTTSITFAVVVPGEPRGYGRTRIAMAGGKPRPVTSKEDRLYRVQIKAAWMKSGCPRLRSGPWSAVVCAYMSRPKAHFNTKGELNAAGLRSEFPSRKPDVDNILKNIDALVALGAVPDDAHLISAHVVKEWADEGGPRVVFRVMTELGSRGDA